MAKRVLIVEDEPDIQEIERMAVEDLLGCDAIVASTGEEALDKAAQSPPDLVVLDLLLPGMDGFTVAARLRADSRLRHANILALSGLSRPEDQKKAREAGCNEVLTKPFDLDELLQKMEKLVAPCASANP